MSFILLINTIYFALPCLRRGDAALWDAGLVLLAESIVSSCSACPCTWGCPGDVHIVLNFKAGVSPPGWAGQDGLRKGWNVLAEGPCLHPPP